MLRLALYANRVCCKSFIDNRNNLPHHYHIMVDMFVISMVAFAFVTMVNVWEGISFAVVACLQSHLSLLDQLSVFPPQ